MIKNCKRCNKAYETSNIRSKNCDECKNRNYYYSKLYKKICKKCNIEFLARGKQTLCDECRKIRPKYNFKNQYIVYHSCKYCKKIVSKENKNKTRNLDSHTIEDMVCDNCKKTIVRENRSIKMKLNNPSYKTKFKNENEYNEYILKKEKIKEYKKSPEYKQILKKNLSDRMKKENPMYNEETKKKILNTIKEKRKNGEIKTKKGKDSPLWKGNRSNYRHWKIILFPWRRRLLEKANFSCQLCGKKKCELNVHHLYPYRLIIKEIKEKYNIIDMSIINLDDELGKVIAKDIIDFHDTHDIGIVVCTNCHSKIDKFYKKRKTNENK
jgi:hypothetical protein